MEGDGRGYTKEGEKGGNFWEFRMGGNRRGGILLSERESKNLKQSIL
jgi:hypothetical protein